MQIAHAKSKKKMSNFVNIAEEGNTDAHYRYKREALQLKVEGRGNGIKTVILNMKTIAESLGLPPEYPTKYFGQECAAQSKYDKKTGRAVVNGCFDQRTMEQILQNFIKKFVLCYTCKLPETTFEITKNETLKMHCKACGNDHTVSPAEKLVTYILKHPPLQKLVKEKKPKPEAEAQVQLEPDTNVSWSQSTSEKAVQDRREKEAISKNLLIMSATDMEKVEEQEKEGEGGEISPVQVLKKYVEMRGTENMAALLAAIEAIKENYKLEDKEVVCLIYEALFDSPDIYKGDIERLGCVFRKFVKTSQTSQKILLGYTEELVSKHMKKLLPYVSVILMQFWQQGLLSEEVVLDWAKSKKKSKFISSAATIQKIKRAAMPFCKWIETQK